MNKKHKRKFRSLIARMNNYGKYPDYISIDDMLPHSIYCCIIECEIQKDVKKLEIPVAFLQKNRTAELLKSSC